MKKIFHAGNPMKKFFEYLYVSIAFAVSCIVFFIVCLATASAIPGQSFSLFDQIFFCCGLLYPVIVIGTNVIVVVRFVKKRKFSILLPALPIIYFFAYMTIFTLIIIIHDTLIYL
jgi:hypothetical protein